MGVLSIICRGWTADKCCKCCVCCMPCFCSECWLGLTIDSCLCCYYKVTDEEPDFEYNTQEERRLSGGISTDVIDLREDMAAPKGESMERGNSNNSSSSISSSGSGAEKKSTRSSFLTRSFRGDAPPLEAKLVDGTSEVANPMQQGSTTGFSTDSTSTAERSFDEMRDGKGNFQREETPNYVPG